MANCNFCGITIEKGTGKMYVKKDGKTLSIGRSYANIASVYLEKGETGKSLEYANKSLDIGEKENLSLHLPERTQALQQELRAWREAIQAPVPTRLNPEYDPNFKPSLQFFKELLREK